MPSLVLGDGARLRQILVNLLGNAVKFTEKGEVAVTADASPAADGALELAFSVRDTGIGIPPDRLDRLFRPGTGLGLVISRELCERMGGSIGVESRPGSGSTFRFTVRVRPAAGAAVAAPLHGAGPAGTVPARGDPASARARRERLRILVAEDNPMNREVARRMLESLGCGADFAEDGLAAVAREASAEFDVVFLDLHMPGFDGLEVARRIRGRAGSGRRPRLIALTASALQGDREASAAAGMEGFLAKPLRMEELRDVLDGIVPAVAVPAPPAPARAVVPLDPAVLGGIRAVGGETLLRDIARLFLSTTPGHALHIREGLAREDARAVRDAAHTLRGSALNVGARRLAAVAEVLETAGHLGDLPAGRAGERDLGPALDAASAAMQAILDGATSPAGARDGQGGSA